ncbi:MAG: DedA family protein [Candidatus Komeilibacteria bacterium]
MDWQAFLETYGYFAFYFLLMVEGQPTYWLGGILLSLNGFSFWPLLLGPFFVLLGDYLFYLVGYKFGSKMLAKRGKVLFLSRRKIDYLANLFDRHMGKAIVISKLAYGVGHNLMLVYGIIQGKWKDAWKWSVLGGTSSYILYVTLGYFLGEGYSIVKDSVERYSVFILLAILVIILGSQIIVNSIKQRKVVLKFSLFNHKDKK